MTATMLVYFDFGGSDTSPGTEQDTTALGPPNIRFKGADNATIDTNNAMVIPDAGTNYSFWKQLYMYCSVAPDTQINNVKLYTDGGGFGTGITVKVGDENPTKTNASDAGYEVASATEMVAAHAGLTGSTDIFSYTSGSPKTISITEAGNIIDAIGETCDYVIVQAEIGTTATSGTKASETYTFVYDEI